MIFPRARLPVAPKITITGGSGEAATGDVFPVGPLIVRRRGSRRSP